MPSKKPFPSPQRFAMLHDIEISKLIEHDFPSGVWRVYTALKFHCGGRNICYPSVETGLVDKSGLSVRTVRKYLRRLEVTGLINVKQRTGRQSVYTMTLLEHNGYPTDQPKQPSDTPVIDARGQDQNSPEKLSTKPRSHRPGVNLTKPKPRSHTTGGGGHTRPGDPGHTGPKPRSHRTGEEILRDKLRDPLRESDAPPDTFGPVASLLKTKTLKPQTPVDQVARIIEHAERSGIDTALTMDEHAELIRQARTDFKDLQKRLIQLGTQGDNGNDRSLSSLAFGDFIQ